MGVWIMSIVGVICLGLLLEIVLPEGQTAKYVRGAFSLLVVFVIAAPLPKLLKKDWSMSLGGYKFEIDEEYVNSTYAAYTRTTAAELEKYLSDNGYAAKVELELSDSTPATLTRIDVKISNFKAQVADEVERSVTDLVCEKTNCDRNIVCVTLNSE